ncbi:MAG: signal recognition particle protein [Fimbriimonadaceae bacterium]
MLDTLTKRITGAFASLRKKGRLSEEDVNQMLREVRVALLEADVNFKIAKSFVKQVKEKAVGEEIYGSLTADETLIKIVRDELVGLLGGGDTPFNWDPQPPTVVLMCGLQGSGKTTTCAKLAQWLKKEGKKTIMAACDVQRPAAIKQLQVLGKQIDVEVYADLQEGADPVKIAQDALERAKHMFADVLIVDTAGRLAIDEPLMQQLHAIADKTKPSETFLVLDSTTGQEAVSVAEAFHERMNLTGAVFTKLDGDTRGGAVLSVREATGVPVRFVGVGEQVSALEMFHPQRMAERIIGMGDVMGIIERAEEALEGEDMGQIESKMRSGQLDFSDMLNQFRMIRKMGSFKNVVKMIPGVSGMVPEEELENLDESRVNRVEAIVLSMTPQERARPDILNGSRRRRIAKGSGTKVEEVNKLVEQLYEMRRGMKQFSKMEKRMKKRGRRR